MPFLPLDLLVLTQAVVYNSLARCYQLVRLICKVGKHCKKNHAHCLVKTAESFGFGWSTAQNDFLFPALKQGQLTFDQFVKIGLS